MPTITFESEIHPGQAKVLAEACRFNTISCGRRWGKTVLAQELISDTAMEQGLPLGYFCPTYKLLAETWRELVDFYALAIAHQDKTERRIETVTGGVVEMWTLEDRDAGRSRKYARIIVDEAGLVPHLEDSWNGAIRPTLADLRGDAFFMGTPKGRNYFHALFNRGKDRLAFPGWRSWQMPTAANPWIDAGEVAAMREGMPERKFRQEILAEFLEDGGVVFRHVRTAATGKALTSGAPGQQYAIGCDWGREDDATVYAVVDVAARRMVAMDRMVKTDYAMQRTRLHALSQAFWRPTILAEENSIGKPIIEQLNREGLRVLPFVTTNASKAQIVDALALALEQKSITLLSDEVLICEMEAYDSEKLPSGVIRYSAPEGQHDDCVIALALAWWQTQSGRTTVVG